MNIPLTLSLISFTLSIYSVLLLRGVGKMSANWSKEAVKWAKIGTAVAIVAIVVAVVLYLLPILTQPKPYIALILQTNNQHPLNDTLWIVNPNKTEASTFTFYINSPDPSVVIAAKSSADVNIEYNKTNSVYVETHNIPGGEMRQINLTFSKYIKPTFKVISTDASNCNTTLEIYVPNVTSMVLMKAYPVWINSTFGCSNPEILSIFIRGSFNMCENFQGNEITFSFCNSNNN